MRRLDSAIPDGLQCLTRVIKLCVRECVSKYRVFDRRANARSSIDVLITPLRAISRARFAYRPPVLQLVNRMRLVDLAKTGRRHQSNEQDA